MPNIKLLSFNVKMISGPGGEPRAKKIASAVLKNNYDIICLQEVFDEDIREIFVKAFKKKFPTIVPKCSDGDIFNDDSGLFFASRFPMRGYGAAKGWGFAEFDEHTGWDSFADKGIFGARLNLDSVSPGFTLLMFNTHLQSDEKYAKVRRAQLQQTALFIQNAVRKVNNPLSTAVILCGDMNVIGDTHKEYSAMMKLLGTPRDAYRESNPGKQGFTWDAKENLNMIPPDDGDRQRLDYVFYFDSFTDVSGQKQPLYHLTSHGVGLQLFGTDKQSRLSDHFAVESVITVQAAVAVKTVQKRTRRSGKNKAPIA